MSVTEDGFKQLVTAPKNLNQLYTRSQFTLCAKDLLRDEDVPDHKIPVRSAAIAQATGTVKGFVRTSAII